MHADQGDEHDVLAERFEAHRARLRAVAYQALGSASEADDAVQETWLRLSRADSGSIENLGGWLTTAVARVCLNMLASRRDEPVGVHLPGPDISDADSLESGKAMRCAAFRSTLETHYFRQKR